MIVDDLVLIRKLPSQALFLDSLLDFLVLVIRFDQVKVIAYCLDAIEVIGIRGINDFAVPEMHLVSAVRYIMCEFKRNHIAQPIAIHNARL